VERIGLAQNRDQWRAFCECGNEPSSFIKCCGNFLVATQLAASREVLSSTELVNSQIKKKRRPVNDHIHAKFCENLSLLVKHRHIYGGTMSVAFLLDWKN
jgi:hypothetical protein